MGNGSKANFQMTDDFFLFSSHCEHHFYSATFFHSGTIPLLKNDKFCFPDEPIPEFSHQ